MVILVFVIGLVMGSFLSAYTYRYPLAISINKGRSICPKCKFQINWYDNIPVLSYLLLQGKCRHCHKKISMRYPIIELTSALLLTMIYFNQTLILSNLPWLQPLNSVLAIIYLLFVTTLLMAVLITDLEHQIIPDFVVFLGFTTTLIILILYNPPLFYHYLFASFFTASLLLILHLVTLGRGMGLGDVKLALFIGLVFGIKGALIWLFLSFVIGSVVGIILILFNLKKFKSRIAFGPFLVLSFYLFLFYGQLITHILFPTF